MIVRIVRCTIALLLFFNQACTSVNTGKQDWVSLYDVVWKSQSENSSASMPLVGGSIGCNVWVEDNELLFYFSSPGAREENGSLMKFGRMRINFEPNIFENAEFEQKLKLNDGAIYINIDSKKTGKTKIKLWAEINRPVIHTEIENESKIHVHAAYENWRCDKLLLPLDTGSNQQRYISWNNAPADPDEVYIYPDTCEPADRTIIFYHRMREEGCFFPRIIEQQKLTAIRDQLYDPVTNLTFGGMLTGDDLKFSRTTEGYYAQTNFKGWEYKTQKPTKSVKIKLYTHISQTNTVDEWKNQLADLVEQKVNDRSLWRENKAWWDQFWMRSYIIINPEKGPEDEGWQVARNYNLFRYMLVSGFFGNEPSMFNGGVLTFDPKYENRQKNIFNLDDTIATSAYTPDYRRWGAGLTAQNQRLLYWPMLKSGDFDGILAEFDFYKRIMPTTQAVVRYFWDHDGLVCEEQPNIAGLLGLAEYGWDNKNVYPSTRYRPKDYEPGVSNNRFIGRLNDSQLEHAFMILQYRKFSGRDISEYLPFIEQSVIFYDEHFRMREKNRNNRELDENGKLVIYPSNTLENHPYSKNPTAVTAGLRSVLASLMELPDSQYVKLRKERWASIMATLPEYPIGEVSGHKYFKPAENWERNHASHNPEMYPLYPYELFGLGMPGLEYMENTYLYTTSKTYRESSKGWSQSVIHSARLGMRENAKKLIIDKIGDGPFRFPAFFPGGDYAPDHNVGGSGMIGLQEMVLQTHNNKIHILPGSPKDWDIEFKLYAPENTVVEVNYKEGKIEKLNIIPKSRENDLVIY